MQPPSIDELEIEFGTAILSDLTGQSLTRNRQPVRLFDQTKHSSEYFFRADEQGKPYIQNFQEGKRYYPITAYCQTYGVDYTAAVSELGQRYLYIADISSVKPRSRVDRPSVLPTPPVDYLSRALYQKCQSRFERNGFYVYLAKLFDPSMAHALFAIYQLGTSRRWLFEGSLATCFPQVDLEGNLRQVKVVPFHPLTGRRAKAHQPAYRLNTRLNQYEPDESEKVWFAGRSFAGSDTANLQQCYFGEHLLGEQPEKPVALVEGESTAVVCSAIWPDYIWLATGGSNGGKWNDPNRFDVLRGRKVVLWPDSGKYEDWSQKAKDLSAITASLSISRYVEENIPAGTSNVDLRDLLTWPRYTPQSGKPIFGEVLAVESSDSYPMEWDDGSQPAQKPCCELLKFPQAPLAWDSTQQLRRIRWCVIPSHLSDEVYDDWLVNKA
ncbi:DUF6371 domain-containing protein [Spirosoma gilvum]